MESPNGITVPMFVFWPSAVPASAVNTNMNEKVLCLNPTIPPPLVPDSNNRSVAKHPWHSNKQLRGFAGLRTDWARGSGYTLNGFYRGSASLASNAVCRMFHRQRVKLHQVVFIHIRHRTDVLQGVAPVLAAESSVG